MSPRVPAVLMLLALLAACGDSDPHTTAGEPSSSAPVAAPGPSAARGLVRTAYPLTVLDDGSGPQLCTAVLQSLPPQCQGLALRGWDWGAHPQHESRGGVRWGEFSVTGRFDGRTLTVTQATPPGEDTAPAVDEPDLSTPCPEPAGGWRVRDPSRTTAQTLEQTMAAASRLPGHARSWLDQSINPASRSSDPQVQETRLNDPTKLIVNVAVAGDVGDAESRLREVWGGMLCVTRAEHTEGELRRIQERLQEVPGLQSTSIGLDVVEAQVWWDDGRLQAWTDDEFGQGLVRVSSVLVPASG